MTERDAEIAHRWHQGQTLRGIGREMRMSPGHVHDRVRAMRAAGVPLEKRAPGLGGPQPEWPANKFVDLTVRGCRTRVLSMDKADAERFAATLARVA